MVEFHFRSRQITKVKINCYFLDQVRHCAMHRDWWWVDDTIQRAGEQELVLMDGGKIALW